MNHPNYEDLSLGTLMAQKQERAEGVHPPALGIPRCIVSWFGFR
jgi:hypothetical protein